MTMPEGLHRTWLLNARPVRRLGGLATRVTFLRPCGTIRPRQTHEAEVLRLPRWSMHGPCTVQVLPVTQPSARRGLWNAGVSSNLPEEGTGEGCQGGVLDSNRDRVASSFVRSLQSPDGSYWHCAERHTGRPPEFHAEIEIQRKVALILPKCQGVTPLHCLAYPRSWYQEHRAPGAFRSPFVRGRLIPSAALRESSFDDLCPRGVFA